MTFMADNTLGLPEALWQFSLTCYACPGVAEACLKLQDKWGANVNILLWLLWLETRGSLVDSTLLTRAEAAIADWDSSLVLPLRALRRHTSHHLHALPGSEASAVSDCYDALKTAELQAERVTQAHLVEVLSAIEWPSVFADPLPLGQNLNPYLERLQVPLAVREELLTLL